MKLIYSWATWLEDIPGAPLKHHPFMGAYTPKAEVGGWRLEGRFADAEVDIAITDIRERFFGRDRTPLKVVPAGDKVPSVGKLTALHHVPGYQTA